jgi:pimeloyl-ACP methyl ester carboxylesterase
MGDAQRLAAGFLETWDAGQPCDGQTVRCRFQNMDTRWARTPRRLCDLSPFATPPDCSVDIGEPPQTRRATANRPNRGPTMTQFQVDMWRRLDGPIAPYSPLPRGSDDRPVVVLLHGALRSSELLFPWANRLADVCEVVLIGLPGHGRSSSSRSLSIQHMAETVGEAIGVACSNRRVLIVGVSLGGAVALAIGGAGCGPVKAVFAADPLMTAGKLWNAARVFRSRMGKSPEPSLIDRLGRVAVGILPSGVEEMIYYPILSWAAASCSVRTSSTAPM